MSRRERVRVDNVPWMLRPAFHAFGYGAGALLQGGLLLARATCEVERVTSAAVPGPRIECFWHEHLPAYIGLCLPPRQGRRYVWMNHPLWYMRPVHLILAWNGVEALALGSTGHGGQAALERVVAHLGEGLSTALAVDGPAGPAHVAKRGAFDMALASGCPLVGIRFEYGSALRAPGWDGKWLPRPGSRVRIFETGPIEVAKESYETSRVALQVALG